LIAAAILFLTETGKFMTTTNVVPFNTGNGDAHLAEASAVADSAIVSDAELQAAAAATILKWQLDAQLFLKLMYANNHKFGQALVLFELVKFHKRNDFDAWCTRSAQEIVDACPVGTANNDMIRYAIGSLDAMQVIESNPVVRNTKRQFRLCPVDLVEMVNSVNPGMPGLDASNPIVPF
jgi:hypothetical protein